ncbi:unnamed protein product, partial [Gulo gulo]
EPEFPSSNRVPFSPSAPAGRSGSAPGGGPPSPPDEGDVDEGPGGVPGRQVLRGPLGHRAPGPAGPEGAGASQSQRSLAGHESRPEAPERREDGPGEPDAAAVRHAGEPRGAAARLHPQLRAAPQGERRRCQSPGKGEGPAGAREVGAAAPSQGGHGPCHGSAVPAGPQGQPDEGAGGRAGHGQAVLSYTDQGRPQAAFTGHARRDGAQRQPGVGGAGRSPTDRGHPAEPADSLPLTPSPPCRPASGQGEPLPLPAALCHLRRVCRRRRPVVHAKRHQLPSAPDTLPLQRRQSRPSTEEPAQPHCT